MFGQMVRETRKMKGIKLIRLAKLAGMSKGHLSGVETEKIKPPKDPKVIKLARILGIHPDRALLLAYVSRMPERIRGMVMAGMIRIPMTP